LSSPLASSESEVLPQRIVKALRDVLGSGHHPLHEPRFAGNELKFLNECLASTFVSSTGEYVTRFESELAAYTGSKRAVAVVNGTAALQTALLLAGVRQGDEVIVPALTFVATANAVHYLGAIPHFVDSNEETLGLDPRSLRDWLSECAEVSERQCFNRQTGRRISALLPVHVFGHPCEIQGLIKVAQDFHLVLVEDAAESIGSFYAERHTGTFGRLGVLSFNGNKTITTGGGGAILTNDEQLANRAKHITTTAKVSHRWEYVHDEIGYNFRMPNLNAALGCAQLEQLGSFLVRKRHLHTLYREAFSDIQGVRLVSEPERCESNYWLQTLILDEELAGYRDAVLAATNDSGFMTRPAWQLLHELPMNRHCPKGPLPVASSLERRIINIPSSPGETVG
jgi:perosamine synthetase